MPHTCAQLCATTHHMASCGTKLCKSVWHQHCSYFPFLSILLWSFHFILFYSLIKFQTKPNKSNNLFIFLEVIINEFLHSYSSPFIFFFFSNNLHNPNKKKKKKKGPRKKRVFWGPLIEGGREAGRVRREESHKQFSFTKTKKHWKEKYSNEKLLV